MFGVNQRKGQTKMSNSYEKAYKFYWTAESDDGAWSDKSKLFETQEECYADMMNHAIDKMKWNVEWDDLVSDTATVVSTNGIVTTREPIGYELKVNADEITHTSYSGTYTWKIKRVVAEWEPKFKCQDIICKGSTVALVVCANEKSENPEDFGYQITIYGQEVPRYDEWTRDANHWIPCDEVDDWIKIGEVTRDVEDGEV
jgi:hypothetical protein